MSRIESLFLRGPAGRIECLLRRAQPDRPSGPAAVVCHPHPLFGGTMNNKVVHAVAGALASAGFAVMRFNFRGAGGSAGTHDRGSGEQEDLRVVLNHLAARYPGAPLLVAGYSFGSYVGLRVGCSDDRVAALVAIAAPVGLYNFAFLQDCTKPLAFVQGEADPIAPLGLVLTLTAVLPQGGKVLPIAGAQHGFANHLEELAARVLEAVPGSIRPGGGSAPPV